MVGSLTVVQVKKSTPVLGVNPNSPHRDQCTALPITVDQVNRFLEHE